MSRKLNVSGCHERVFEQCCRPSLNHRIKFVWETGIESGDSVILGELEEVDVRLSGVLADKV